MFQGVLDLDDVPANREDPLKLLKISNNSLNLVVRYLNKGVKVHSLSDGSIIHEMKGMHTNYITSILLTKDD